MQNEKIRNALNAYSVKQWELAEIMGISEFSLSRKFRHELPEDKQNELIALIKEKAGSR